MSAILTAPAPPAAGLTLSPSQASMYLSCSAKWFYRYGLGLPDPAAGGMVRGKAVHAIVGYYLAAKMEGVELEPAGLDDAYEHAWDAAAGGAVFSPLDDVAQLKASGAALAAKYIREVAPAIEPAAIELPVAGVISGVAVRGIIDIVDTAGRIIDLKTASRRSSTISADHALQLATYAQLLDSASGETRIDQLISTKEPQLVQIEHTPGAAGARLVERIYPLVAEGIGAGVFCPNRSSVTCSQRYCNFWRECEAEYGGTVE